MIAAVNGLALGGGFEIALACHLIVADAAAEFGLSEIRTGIPAAGGGLDRLPRMVPPKIAMELILTGRRLPAAEALGYGLVNRVTETGRALDGALALAAEVLQGSPTAVAASLRILAGVQDLSDVLDDLMMSADTAEGIAALAEGRRPAWRNR